VPAEADTIGGATVVAVDVVVPGSEEAVGLTVPVSVDFSTPRSERNSLAAATPSSVELPSLGITVVS
jgi:hypothetical protein